MTALQGKCRSLCFGGVWKNALQVLFAADQKAEWFSAGCRRSPVQEARSHLRNRFGSSIAMYLGARRTEIHASVLSVEHARSLKKAAWQVASFFLLLLQLAVAVLGGVFWSQNRLLKVTKPHLSLHQSISTVVSRFFY